MQDFVMIPYSLIENRELGDKRVLIYASILFSGWTGNRIDKLAHYSGFSVRRNAGGILHQYKELVNNLITANYFEYTPSGLCPVQHEEQFGIIYADEFRSILQARDSGIDYGRRINHAHMLLLLAHIRLCMIHQENVPLFYSNLINRVSLRIGISSRSITKAVAMLEKLDIVHSEELPRYKDNLGNWHSNVRIFVNMNGHTNNYDWQEEAVKGIRYIMSRQID